MLSAKQQQMVALFEKHVGAELEGNLDTTMATMSDTFDDRMARSSGA